MTKCELKALISCAASLLKMYADELGTHGCNDFDLAYMLPNAEERKHFVKEYHDWNGDPEEFDPDNLNLPDFAVVGFLAHRLDKLNETLHQHKC